jgi:hypothetical protein
MRREFPFSISAIAEGCGKKWETVVKVYRGKEPVRQSTYNAVVGAARHLNLPPPPPRVMPPLAIQARDPGFPEVVNRAPTRPTIGVTASFAAGAIGEASVTLLESTDGCDRGGFVLRLELEGASAVCLPVCRQTEDGIEIHLPGSTEADAWINALLAVLPYRRHSKFEIVGPTPPKPEAV